MFHSLIKAFVALLFVGAAAGTHAGTVKVSSGLFEFAYADDNGVSLSAITAAGKTDVEMTFSVTCEAVVCPLPALQVMRNPSGAAGAIELLTAQFAVTASGLQPSFLALSGLLRGQDRGQDPIIEALFDAVDVAPFTSTFFDLTSLQDASLRMLKPSDVVVFKTTVENFDSLSMIELNSLAFSFSGIGSDLAIPEPTTGLLVALAFMAAASRRRISRPTL